MKKIIFSTLFTLFLAYTCFAQTPTHKTAHKSQVTSANSIIGKVDSITLGNVTKKTKAQIVIVDDKEQKTNFMVNNNITTYDKDNNVTTLAKIAKGDTIAITKNGKNKVNSIKIIK